MANFRKAHCAPLRPTKKSSRRRKARSVPSVVVSMQRPHLKKKSREPFNCREAAREKNFWDFFLAWFSFLFSGAECAGASRGGSPLSFEPQRKNGRKRRGKSGTPRPNGVPCRKARKKRDNKTESPTASAADNNTKLFCGDPPKARSDNKAALASPRARRHQRVDPRKFCAVPEYIHEKTGINLDIYLL